MAKKLVAVTEIRHDDKIIPAGDTLDASMFEKSQLEALYDAGAVRVDDAPTNTETPKTSAEASSTATATPAPAKSTSAPAVKGTADGKGNAK